MKTYRVSTEAYLCLYSSCPTLVFCRLEKYFILLFLHESWVKFISNQFVSCTAVFSNYLYINIFPSHSKQPYSVPLELIDRLLCKRKIDFKLIKIQLCEAKISVMGVESRTPATSKVQIFVSIQKQPSRGVLSKRCYENMQQIYRRTSMPKCDFNKVAKQLYCNHTSARFSPIHLLYIFRTPFTKNTYEQLRLSIVKEWKLSKIVTRVKCFVLTLRK